MSKHLRRTAVLSVMAFLALASQAQTVVESYSSPVAFSINPRTDTVCPHSDVDLDIPVSRTVNENCYVVIVANEQYKRVADVPYALNDGRVFREYCTKTLGIPSRQVHLVENATINDIKHEVDWLKRFMKIKDGNARAIFYYSGHGVPDEDTKKAYLFPVDGYASNASTGYALDELYADLGSVPSQSVTYFIDACFSGSTREDKPLEGAKSVAIKAKSGSLQGNAVTFTASTGDQTATFYEEKRHGLFTYFLLKKLKESGGVVTYEELAQYLTKMVTEQALWTNKNQTPMTDATQNVEWRNWKLK